MPTAGSIRERNRADITRAIVIEGRRQLARDGAAALSLRSVARELGMVSSAVYRYVANRDDLLTLLIIDAYDALGAAVEKAEAGVERRDARGRWLAAARALRTWALAHPHRYALLYGSPVPGYVAPQSTIGPATRTMAVLAGVLRDADPAVPAGDPAVPSGLRADLRALRATPLLDGSDVPDSVLVRAVLAWTSLFGVVSFELNGQYTNVIEHREQWFDHCAGLLADEMGLPRRRARR